MNFHNTHDITSWLFIPWCHLMIIHNTHDVTSWIFTTLWRHLMNIHNFWRHVMNISNAHDVTSWIFINPWLYVMKIQTMTSLHEYSQPWHHLMNIHNTHASKSMNPEYSMTSLKVNLWIFKVHTTSIYEHSKFTFWLKTALLNIQNTINYTFVTYENITEYWSWYYKHWNIEI